MDICELEYLGPPTVGGVEKVVTELARRFEREGDRVRIWSSNLASFRGGWLPAVESKVDGFSVTRFAARRSRLFLLDPYHLRWEGLAAAVARESGRLLFHSHAFPSYHSLLVLAQGRRPPGVVITPHQTLRALHHYLRLRRSRFTFGRLQAAMRRWPHISLSVHVPAEHRFFLEQLAIPEEKVRIIPNGVDPAEFDTVTPQEAEQAWQRQGLADCFRVLFVGRLVWEKGVDLLIRALPLARRKEARLLVAGPDGGAAASLQQLVDELKLRSQVSFCWVERRELCKLIKGCHVLVLPSRRGENFGIALLEAMACSKPVIGSTNGGIPQVIRDGLTGLVFPSEDAGELAVCLRTLIKEDALRERMGIAGRALVESQYNWDHIAASFRQLFKETAER